MFTVFGRPHALVAPVLVATIGIVFVAPAVDLEPTAMRATRAASATLLAIAAVGQMVTSLSLLLRSQFQTSAIYLDRWNDLLKTSLVDLNCTRLC